MATILEQQQQKHIAELRVSAGEFLNVIGNINRLYQDYIFGGFATNLPRVDEFENPIDLVSIGLEGFMQN